MMRAAKAGRRAVLALAALLPCPAQAGHFPVPQGKRMRLVGRAEGWTVLRDVTAWPQRAETGMVLIRPQRPVAPALRPGHLTALLRNFRPFRFGPLPPETMARIAGLPAAVIETRATGASSGASLIVRAECLFAPERSWLLIASAPEAEWPELRSEMLAILEGFRPA